MGCVHRETITSIILNPPTSWRQISDVWNLNIGPAISTSNVLPSQFKHWTSTRFSMNHSWHTYQVAEHMMLRIVDNCAKEVLSPQKCHPLLTQKTLPPKFLPSHKQCVRCQAPELISYREVIFLILQMENDFTQQE